MGTTENKEVVRQFYESVMNQTGPADLDPLMAEDFVDHGETLFGSPKGREILERGHRLRARHPARPTRQP